MIVATQNVYYNNRMFKPKEALPSYDIKMVQAWIKSGVAKDTEAEQRKSAPAESVKEDEEKLKEKSKMKVKTRSKK